MRDTVVGLLCFLLLGPSLAGQYGRGGARTVAMAGSSTALGAGFGSRSNPAAVGLADRRMVAFSAGRLFGLRTLGELALTIRLPVRFGATGLELEKLGSGGFGYFRGRLAAGFPKRKPGGAGAVAGIALDRYVLLITGSDKYTATGISAGIQTNVTDFFAVGCAVYNVNRPRWSRDSPLPSSLRMGIAFKPRDRTSLLLATEKPARHPPSVAWGAETILAGRLAVRVGVAINPMRFGAGIGLSSGHITADFAADHHAYLGWSPAVTVTAYP